MQKNRDPAYHPDTYHHKCYLDDVETILMAFDQEENKDKEKTFGF